MIIVFYYQDKNENKEDKSKDKKKDKKEEEKPAGPDLTAQQGVAVLGLALISMGEDIGSEMCFRSFSHLVSCFSEHSFLMVMSLKFCF